MQTLDNYFSALQDIGINQLKEWVEILSNFETAPTP